QGLIISVSVIAAFLIGLKDNPAVATTMAFSTLTFARLLHGFNCRSQHSIFKIGFKNNWYSLAAFALGTALLALILFVPGLHSLFAVTPLAGQEVLWIAGLALIPTVLIQAAKMVRK
ncbi:MAG: cation-translocating P-type ATPase C-terminal domain-containing protein, partial [Lactobacillus crispatus]|nr:cation-translocating P-type ATPase C-terminal domain-containing protein [Lactobacillus crispatus]